MTGASMADRRYEELIEPDRADQLERMRERLRELNRDEDMRALDALMSGWGATEEAKQHDTPVSAVVELIAGQVKEAMGDLGADRDRLATVRVGSLLDEAVSAQMQPFSDGSSLVLVSDSILSLAGIYSTYAGAAFTQIGSGGALKGMWRTFRAVRAGGLGEDPFLLAGLLRYHNVHQRVHGLAAKLGLSGNEDASGVAAMVLMLAGQFVIGHEVAHHALGHTSALSAFSPGEHVPVCSEDEERELAADLLAYHTATRAFELEISRNPELRGKVSIPDAGSVFAMLGALVAVLVIHASEQALFVRRGCTHPPASERAARLLTRLEPSTQQLAQLFLRNMLTATVAASDFGDSAQAFDWGRLAAEPRLHTPHPPEYMRQIARFDRLMCISKSAAVDALEKKEINSDLLIGRGAHMAAKGDAREALLTWGISGSTADRFCDTRQGTAKGGEKDSGEDHHLPSVLAGLAGAPPSLRGSWPVSTSEPRIPSGRIGRSHC